MSLHFCTTVEATPRFAAMAELWAFSFRRFAGALADATLRVTFNDRADEATAERLERLGVRVSVRPRLSARHREANKYNALLAAQGLVGPDEWLVLTDADVACAGPLDALAELLERAVGIDLWASPAGHPMPLPRAGRPRGYRPIRRYGELIRARTGVTAEELPAFRHARFEGVWPDTTYPYFSSGVLAIRGSALEALSPAIISETAALYALARPGPATPLRLLARWWNRRVHRTGWAERLCVGPYHSARLADQVALTTAAIRLGVKWGVLPLRYNWHDLDAGPRDEPVELVHYVGKTDWITRDDWLASFAGSDNAGRSALARVVSAWHEDAHRAVPASAPGAANVPNAPGPPGTAGAPGTARPRA